MEDHQRELVTRRFFYITNSIEMLLTPKQDS